ncbi:hypothetical protein JCM1393_13840 [Clostridium carnis]
MNIKPKEIYKYDNKNQCIICRKEKDNGIIIAKRLLCQSCYNKIANCSIEDANYKFYVDKIKENLISKFNI